MGAVAFIISSLLSAAIGYAVPWMYSRGGRFYWCCQHVRSWLSDDEVRWDIELCFRDVGMMHASTGFLATVQQRNDCQVAQVSPHAGGPIVATWCGATVRSLPQPLQAQANGGDAHGTFCLEIKSMRCGYRRMGKRVDMLFDFVEDIENRAQRAADSYSALVYLEDRNPYLGAALAPQHVGSVRSLNMVLNIRDNEGRADQPQRAAVLTLDRLSVSSTSRHDFETVLRGFLSYGGGVPIAQLQRPEVRRPA